MDVSSRSRSGKRTPYRLKCLPLHLAGYQLCFNDEECIIAFAAQRNTDLAENIFSWVNSESGELRMHLTRPQYALLKRLLEHPGEIAPFDDLIALVLRFSWPQPTHPLRALANHIYRLRRILPKFLVIYCESGTGYALLLLPAEALYPPGDFS